MKKLFVFDLDFTIWDAGGTWCDCTYPPYRKQGDVILDVDQREIKLYPDVKRILEHLADSDKMMTAASRTTAPHIAGQLLQMFAIDHYFQMPQIYPDSKLVHFAKLREAFGVDYSEMVFFDDEYRNIREVSQLGVACEYLEEYGVTWDVVSPWV